MKILWKQRGAWKWSLSPFVSIVALSDVIGGTVAPQVSEGVLFTPDTNYKGVMSYKYSVADAGNDGEWRVRA